jgi:two-component system, cell cycle sensor histidine kinase and response regulator CckA
MADLQGGHPWDSKSKPVGHTFDSPMEPDLMNASGANRRLSRCLCRWSVSLNFILFAGLGWLIATAANAAPGSPSVEKKSILVLTQGNGRQRSFIEFTSGLQQGLITNLHQPVMVYIENLDFEHFSNLDYRRAIVEWLRIKYHGLKPDAIVTENEQTVDIAFKIRAELWPQVPVVYVDSGRTEVARIAAHTNYTRVWACPDVQRTLTVALQLCPDTRRIAFVSSLGNSYLELYRHDLKQVEDFATNRFEVIKLIGLSLDETRQRLATLPPQTIAFYNGIWLDAAEQVFTTPDALEEISPCSAAPIFSCADTHLGHGAVGGSCRVYQIIGAETAGQVAAVIKAGSANAVPAVQSAGNRFIFDWQQLQRYGLDRHNLPRESEVRFRTLTLWQTYHHVVIIATAVLVVQTGLIVALLLHRRRMRRTEEELYNSRQMLRTVLDTIPQRVFWKDSHSVFLGCNQSMARDCGFPGPAELIGKTDEATAGAALAERYRADDREVMETNQPKLNYEKPQRRPDGSRRWLLLNKVPLHDRDGSVIGVLGTYDDITKLKHANAVLRESDQRFRLLLDNAPDAVYVQTNQRIVYANQATLRLLRAEQPEQLLGQPVLDFVAPEWRETVKQRMQQVNTNNNPLPALEEEYLTVDRTRVTVEVTAVPTVLQGEQGALVFVRDITERKRTMETIAYERQLLRTLLDLMPYGVYIKDLDSNFLMANETLAKRFGKNHPAELLGTSDMDFFPPEVAAVFRADEAKVFAGETINEKEEIVLFPNGQERTLLTTKVPFRNSQGLICGLVGIGRDVTEHKLLEEQFRQSQKMEAFGQLAGGVAHDFNNLLTVIEGHVALLQLKEDSSPAERASGLAEIAKAAERAANLTRQLLTFSRRQLFQPKPVDLDDIVANTTKMLQRLIGEHLGLETHSTPGGAPIIADRNMMEQILINLAVNSRDAMPKGGKLVIRTDTVTISEADIATHPKARPGTFIRLSVTDTGCGIAQTEMERIFEPFFTTKEVGKGTGLGLATVFGIVTQHHGWIDVKSKLNEGTIFHVYLPRMKGKESAPAGTPRPPEIRGGHETILLVEDEAPVRSLVRTLLERKGYHIIEADSGLNALEIWQLKHNQIDLLFTDMVMPDGISGRDLATRLLIDKPELKVIYASGYTDDMLGESSPLRNNPNFLEKPFESQKLLKRVRDCLDGVTGT